MGGEIEMSRREFIMRSIGYSAGTLGLVLLLPDFTSSLESKVLDKNVVKHGFVAVKKDNVKEKPGLVYIIDPGHGYAGPKKEHVGTTILNGPLERDYVLGVGISLTSFLNSKGYKTKMTRTEKSTKSTLQDRSDVADKTKDGVLVSLHVNGAEYEDRTINPHPHGVIVFYNDNPDSKILAQYQSDNLKPIFGKSEIRYNNVPQYNFKVLTATESPAVLVELGFGGSNKHDARILLTKQEQITSALGNSLDAYYKSKNN